LAQRAALWSSIDTVPARRLDVSSAENKHGSVVTLDPPLELGGGTPLAELEATVTTIARRESEVNDGQSATGRHRQAIAGLEGQRRKPTIQWLHQLHEAAVQRIARSEGPGTDGRNAGAKLASPSDDCR